MEQETIEILNNTKISVILFYAQKKPELLAENPYLKYPDN